MVYIVLQYNRQIDRIEYYKYILILILTNQIQILTHVQAGNIHTRINNVWSPKLESAVWRQQL